MTAPLIAVVGATATGKSDLGLWLADALGGEIVNADAMQLFRGMDIGTAKLSAAERRGIAHHQLDQLDVNQDASVAAYQRHARADIAAIEARGHRAIVVGGSGLYVRALLDELDFPGTDPTVRERLTRRAEAEGAPALHAELARRDPEAAARIEPGNARRIVRALEVIEITGRPFTAALPTPRYHRPTIQLGLRAEMDWLDERIAQRTAAMLAAGFVQEVERLAAHGLRTGQAGRAVGYRQVLDFLAGRIGADELPGAIALATRQLARRQVKWFRRDARICWLDAAAPDVGPAALAGLARAEEQVSSEGERPAESGSPSRWRA